MVKPRDRATRGSRRSLKCRTLSLSRKTRTVISWKSDSKKSSKTSSPKTADYAVNSLLALLTGAAGLFGITLINKKRKEDEE